MAEEEFDAEQPPVHVKLRTMLVLMANHTEIWDELGIQMPKDSEYTSFMKGADMIVSFLEDRAGVVFTATDEGAFEWRPKRAAE